MHTNEGDEVTDFTKCKYDCRTCPGTQALPAWCNGRCSSCEWVHKCPCCNEKVREQIRQADTDPTRREEIPDRPEEFVIKISQLEYPGPWQQRPLGNAFVRKLARDMRERGQIEPITVRRRASTNGRPIYQVVNGDGRARAGKLNGCDTLRAVVKEMEDWEAYVCYLLDNMAERNMPWEEVALGILAVEKALARKTGHPCNSRQLGKVLRRSKDWINDHKRAFRVVQAHGIPRGFVPHYKLLRPLGYGIPFAIEETILQGIINEKWTLERVQIEVQERCGRQAPACRRGIRVHISTSHPGTFLPCGSLPGRLTASSDHSLSAICR